MVHLGLACASMKHPWPARFRSVLKPRDRPWNSTIRQRATSEPLACLLPLALSATRQALRLVGQDPACLHASSALIEQCRCRALHTQVMSAQSGNYAAHLLGNAAGSNNLHHSVRSYQTPAVFSHVDSSRPDVPEVLHVVSLSQPSTF